MTDHGLLLAAALLVAWGVDRFFGEPRVTLHPVVWMGRYLTWGGNRLRMWAPVPAFAGGVALWLVGAAGVAALSWGVQVILFSISGMAPWGKLLAAAVLGVLLKPLFAWRLLRDEVAAVESALDEGLAAGRTRLARLVSRDVSRLDATEVRESAIESLAENLNDSLVAPLFWFVLFGLPGAALYRFANTADAMWGYRDHREWSGKWAARADDTLSWVPARITAVLLFVAGKAPAKAWRHWPIEAGRTPSPNSGHPMAAMALLLDVQLSKPGVYVLHGSGRKPRMEDMKRALCIAADTTTLVVTLALVMLVIVNG